MAEPSVTTGGALAQLSNFSCAPDELPHVGRPKRLASVDSLRGIAAVAVVLTHASINVKPTWAVPTWYRWLSRGFTWGELGVPLFFVISGFCIHLTWAKARAVSQRSYPGFIAFWKRRFFRLYPPYLVVLCISMTYVLMAYLRNGNASILANYPNPRLKWIGLDFVAHLLMVHGFHPRLDHAGGNAVYWTLAREEYFYLMYFILLAWIRRRSSISALAGTLAIGIVTPAAMSLFLRQGSEWWALVYQSAPVLWFQWCLGLVAAEAYVSLILLPKWCYSWLMVPVWALLAVAAKALGPAIDAALWGMVFFTVLNCCTRTETKGRWPAGIVSRTAAAIGEFSYSLYLIHMLVLVVLCQVLPSLIHPANPVLALCGIGLVTICSCVAA
jgi:peptidoglycan/LPS O-acetylase OafA/YrhL